MFALPILRNLGHFSRVCCDRGGNSQLLTSPLAKSIFHQIQNHRHLVSRSSINRGNMASEKPKVIFVLGAPGAGKGTQCSKIVDEYGYVHLSAGELLREERQRPGSEFGELIESTIQNGRIVPVEVTCSLLDKAMQKSSEETGKNKFLIDGFPRNQDNVDGWIRQMNDKTELQFVLVFDCTEEMCIDRVLKRGAAGSGRSDDNIESLKKRFNTFYHDSMPIVELYSADNLVVHVDGTNDPDTVFEQVKKVFKEKCV